MLYCALLCDFKGYIKLLCYLEIKKREKSDNATLSRYCLITL